MLLVESCPWCFLGGSRLGFIVVPCFLHYLYLCYIINELWHMDPALFHIVVTFQALRAMVYLTHLKENWSLMLIKCRQEHQSVLDLVFDEKHVFVCLFFTFISGSKHRIWSITEFWETVCCIFSFLLSLHAWKHHSLSVTPLFLTTSPKTLFTVHFRNEYPWLMRDDSGVIISKTSATKRTDHLCDKIEH